MERNCPGKQSGAANKNQPDIVGMTCSHNDEVRVKTFSPDACCGGPDRTIESSREAEILHDDTPRKHGTHVPGPDQLETLKCTVSELTEDILTDEKCLLRRGCAEEKCSTRPSGACPTIGGKNSEPLSISRDGELPAANLENFKNALGDVSGLDAYDDHHLKVCQKQLEYQIDRKKSETHHLGDHQVVAPDRNGQYVGDDGKSHSTIMTSFDDRQCQKQTCTNGSDESDNQKIGEEDTELAFADKKDYQESETLDGEGHATMNVLTHGALSNGYTAISNTERECLHEHVSSPSEHTHLNRREINGGTNAYYKESNVLIKNFLFIDITVAEETTTGDTEPETIRQNAGECGQPGAVSGCNAQPMIKDRCPQFFRHLGKLHQDKNNHPATMYLHQNDVEEGEHDEEAYLGLYQNNIRQPNSTGESPSDAHYHTEKTTTSECKTDNSPPDCHDHAGQENSPKDHACNFFGENEKRNCNNEAVGHEERPADTFADVHVDAGRIPKDNCREENIESDVPLTKQDRGVAFARQHPGEKQSASENLSHETKISMASLGSVDNTEVKQIADDTRSERDEDGCQGDHRDLSLRVTQNAAQGELIPHLGDGSTGHQDTNEEDVSCRAHQTTKWKNVAPGATRHVENTNVFHDDISLTKDKDVSCVTHKDAKKRTILLDSDQCLAITDSTDQRAENREVPSDVDDDDVSVAYDHRGTKDGDNSWCDTFDTNTIGVSFDTESHTDEGDVSHNDVQHTVDTQYCSDCRFQDAQQTSWNHDQNTRNNHNAVMSTLPHLEETQCKNTIYQHETEHREHTRIDFTDLEQDEAQLFTSKYGDTSLHAEDLHQNSLNETEPCDTYQSTNEDRFSDISLAVHEEERQYRKPSLVYLPALADHYTAAAICFPTPPEDIQTKSCFLVHPMIEDGLDKNHLQNANEYPSLINLFFRGHTGVHFLWRVQSFLINIIVFPSGGQGFEPGPRNPPSDDEGGEAQGENRDVPPHQETIQPVASSRRIGIRTDENQSAPRSSVVRHRGHRQLPTRLGDRVLQPCPQCLLIHTRGNVSK